MRASSPLALLSLVDSVVLSCGLFSRSFFGCVSRTFGRGGIVGGGSVAITIAFAFGRGGGFATTVCGTTATNTETNDANAQNCKKSELLHGYDLSDYVVHFRSYIGPIPYRARYSIEPVTGRSPIRMASGLSTR